MPMVILNKIELYKQNVELFTGVEIFIKLCFYYTFLNIKLAIEI